MISELYARSYCYHKVVNMNTFFFMIHTINIFCFKCLKVLCIDNFYFLFIITGHKHFIKIILYDIVF